MSRFLLSLATLIGFTLLGTGPSRPYYHGRWCAVVDTGAGSVQEICHFRNFEACRLEVVSGNRGFCRPNSYYVEPRDWRAKRNRYRY